jgi:nitrous-oxide reductase
MHVVGVPSMRLLKTIPVFAPDAWSGYGFGADWSMELLEEGSDPNQNEPLTWGDTHHPALSETDGDYDGRFLYINDRANGRFAMVDLRDFKTKQILDVPNMQSSHGGVFATPNTEYVHISAKTPSPIFVETATPRGGVRRALPRRVDLPGRRPGHRPDRPGAELPDRAAPLQPGPRRRGKLASDGWAFINSYNVEMATGGIWTATRRSRPAPSPTTSTTCTSSTGRRPSRSSGDGKYEMVNGVRMIRLETAIDEGILHFAPEPRNPHGVDVSPDGNYIVVSASSTRTPPSTRSTRSRRPSPPGLRRDRPLRRSRSSASTR